MNMKRRKTNTVCFFAGLLWCSLVCVFPSCDSEVENRAPSGALSSTLSVSCLPFGADNETAARSSGLRRRAPETVEIPLEDRWILSATLEEEEVSPTRTAGLYDEINNGARFVVVASQVGSSGSPQVAEYIYNSTTKQLEKKPGATAIELTTGKYKYVYYSYNSTTSVPTYNSGSGRIDVTPNPGATTNNDLLWGTSGEVEVGTKINVSLSHKFTRVKLRMGTTEATGATLSGVSASLETNYSGVLTVSTGDFYSSTATTAQSLSPTGSKSVSSTVYMDGNYQLVHTAGQSKVKVKISGKIGNNTFSNTPTFAGPLAAGRSYVLWVRFQKRIRWAESNIYWDGSKLTFKAHGDPCANKENYYQGVIFRWGSLVGCSPVGDFDAGTAGQPSTGTTIYVRHNNQWLATNSATAYANGYPDFLDIKSFVGLPSKRINRDSPTNQLDDSFSGNIGDICRYIGSLGGPSGYRMPYFRDYFTNSIGGERRWDNGTANAMGWYVGSTSFATPTVGQDDAAGQRLIGSAEGTGGYATNYGSTFPTAGYRTHFINPQWGTGYVGTQGVYWCNDVNAGAATMYVYTMFFDDTATNVHQAASNNGQGFPTRCVLDD
jgi:hypothetical protein